jgi:hypothetical protein
MSRACLFFTMVSTRSNEARIRAFDIHHRNPLELPVGLQVIQPLSRSEIPPLECAGRASAATGARLRAVPHLNSSQIDDQKRRNARTPFGPA